MMLPFTDELVVVPKFDREMAVFSDEHYSRQKPGSNQFMPPGFTIVIRNNEGTLLFGWLRQIHRDDGEEGYNCSIFRNTSDRLSSSVILECERIAFEKWGPARTFTYVNPRRLRTIKRRGVEFCRYPAGRCFIEAGYRLVRQTNDGKHLLAKDLRLPTEGESL